MESTALNSSTVTVIAEFTAQEWIGDTAIEVDPEGPTTWDCTADFAALDEHYRNELIDEMTRSEGALDHRDHLVEGSTAPEWVRSWDGPFDLRVRVATAEAV